MFHNVIGLITGLAVLWCLDFADAQTISIRPVPNTFVDGDGYAVVKPSTLSDCERRCVADQQCLMFEFYKPDRKCNLFDHVRAAGPSAEAEVGIKELVSNSAGLPIGQGKTAANPGNTGPGSSREATTSAGGRGEDEAQGGPRRPARQEPPVVSKAPPSRADPKVHIALACPGLYPGGIFQFTGLNPAIEGKAAPEKFKAGEIVEIDPLTMSAAEAKAMIAGLHARGARVSMYHAGGHCVYGRAKDCDSLKGVRLGPTGSWNWDKEEKRILDITHPAVIKRLKSGVETGWRLGLNYVRIDNLHFPAGSREERTSGQMLEIFTAIHDVEDRLRQEGVIPEDLPTGVVAHNNLEVWEQLVGSGQLRRPPVFLTSERTAQLAFKGQGYKGDGLLKAGKLRPTDVPEILAGGRMAEALGIPYTVAEFGISHDLGNKPGATYKLPQAYVDELRQLRGISEVIVIPSETHYVGRGKAYLGPGPRYLPMAPHPEQSGKLAAACLRQLAGARP
jgi:PAN domain